MMKSKSDILIILSVIAVVISAADFLFKIDIVSLAGTQWILIAIVFGIYGLYAKLKA